MSENTKNTEITTETKNTEVTEVKKKPNKVISFITNNKVLIGVGAACTIIGAIGGYIACNAVHHESRETIPFDDSLDNIFNEDVSTGLVDKAVEVTEAIPDSGVAEA